MKQCSHFTDSAAEKMNDVGETSSDMSPVHPAWQRPSCKALQGEEGKGEGKGSGENSTPESGQGWTVHCLSHRAVEDNVREWTGMDYPASQEANVRE